MVNVGGIAGFGLQAPDEAGRLLSQRVDVIQSVHEFLDLGMVHGMQQPSHVQLGEVKGHKSIVAETPPGELSAWIPHRRGDDISLDEIERFAI